MTIAGVVDVNGEGAEATPAIHDLKVHPIHYRAIASGRKTFEVRMNDRDFQEGDLLRLREWHPILKRFTGNFQIRRIGSVFCDGSSQAVPDGILDPGWVILSLLPD